MKDRTRVIRDAFEAQTVKWNDIIETELDDFCSKLLLDAVIENRRRNPEAHQFTGNLINSIVIILFRKDTGEQRNYYAYDRLKSPIRREMSARTRRGTMRKNAVHFRPDWQGRPHSMYLPEVVTDESLGPSDARAFAASWRPVTGKNFEICVAYTSEYGDWVETERQSTGYFNSKRYASKAMVGIGFTKIGTKTS